MQSKVSVIIPVYNVEKYLSQCIDSLINQSLKDIEIICIDDKSTDNSLEILKLYAQKDNRIKVIPLEKNIGQGEARNIGINSSNGEYIGFVDPDDWVKVDMFEKMYLQAKNLNSDIVICSFAKYRDFDGKIIKPVFFKKMTSFGKTKKINIKDGRNITKKIINQTLLISPCYAWNRIYKADLLKNNNIKFTDLRCFEDVKFILNSHLLANNISYINDTLYFYRLRKTSTLGSYEQRYICLLKLFDELINSDLPKDLSDNIRYFIVMNTLYTLKNLKNEAFKDELLFEVKKYVNTDDYKFLKKKLTLSLLQKIFSITNNGEYKIITFLGIKIKHNRRKPNSFAVMKKLDNKIKNCSLRLKSFRFENYKNKQIKNKGNLKTYFEKLYSNKTPW